MTIYCGTGINVHATIYCGAYGIAHVTIYRDTCENATIYHSAYNRHCHIPQSMKGGQKEP